MSNLQEMAPQWLRNGCLKKFRFYESILEFREIHYCFYFAKQIIYLESPDHVLQNDI